MKRVVLLGSVSEGCGCELASRALAPEPCKPIHSHPQLNNFRHHMVNMRDKGTRYKSSGNQDHSYACPGPQELRSRLGNNNTKRHNCCRNRAHASDGLATIGLNRIVAFQS